MDTLYIFSERLTNRLKYVAQLLAERWYVNVEVTNDRTILSNHSLAVYNYSKCESVFPQTTPAPLLFEKRVQAQELMPQRVGEVTLLFYNKKDDFLSHDPLASAFYLLSRYEEYLPHVKDEHGRFTSESSVLSGLDSIQVPLADIYIERLRLGLQKRFSSLKLKQSETSIEFTFDIDQLFLYKSKGIARSVLGGIKDIVQARSNLSKRLEVAAGSSDDPLDIYDHLISRVKNFKNGTTPRFFFQVGETSRYDVNNPVHLPQVQDRINEIALESDIGLHPSYFSSEDQRILETEHDRLKKSTQQKIEHSRQHYLRFTLPDTYRLLDQIGITHDYSMGYADCNGFRAGTSHPFRFYDLLGEEILGLTAHPLVFMDLASVRNDGSVAECIQEIQLIYNSINRIGGVFSTTWHPEVLIGLHVPFASMPIFDYCIKELAIETN